jgi:hypothetical protein
MGTEHLNEFTVMSLSAQIISFTLFSVALLSVIKCFILFIVSKLFYKDGSGDPLYAPTYLREQGINKVPIMNNRGNRFNTRTLK